MIFLSSPFLLCCLCVCVRVCVCVCLCVCARHLKCYVINVEPGCFKGGTPYDPHVK